MSDLPPYGEYLIEEDGSPLPHLHEFDDTDDPLQVNGTATAAQPASLLSPSMTFAKTPESHFGSGDSISDSSSSKRTTSTASTHKTAATSIDVTMSDGPDVKPHLNFSDYIHMEDDGLNGDINPDIYSNGDDQLFGIPSKGTFGDLNGPSTIPGPFNSSATVFSSFMSQGPGGGPAHAASSPDASEVTGGFVKGSAFSLTQGMYGLNTNGSREVSPMSNIIPSQDSSPSAFLNSPPATEPFKFTAGPVYQPQWPGNFSMDLGLQANGGSMHMPGSISSPMAAVPYLTQALYGPGPYKLKVHPIPGKSRVETQIPIKLTMTTLPVGIKKLHLPTHTISKPKLLAKPTPVPSQDTLELHTVLVCTSAMQHPENKEGALRRARNAATGVKKTPTAKDERDEEIESQDGGDVNICPGCITRERKRASRKKVKKPEDEQLWQQNESRRVIVFNTQEIKDWQQAQPDEQGLGGTGFHVDIPMRVACYCRHHGEKMGFQVIFTITDHTGQLIAQSMSPSIMITDDHKTHVAPNAGAVSEGVHGPPTKQQDMENSLSPPAAPFRVSHSTSDLQNVKRNASVSSPNTAVSPSGQALSPGTSTLPTPRNLSRPASPTGLLGPSNKKRKSSGSAKVPSGLAMTRLETGSNQPSTSQNAQATSATSPFSASTTFPGVNEQTAFSAGGMALSVSGAPLPPAFAAGSASPNGHEQSLFAAANANGPGHLESLGLANLYPAPTSGHPSRAPSPNSGLRASATALLQQNGQFAHSMASNLAGFHGLPLAVSTPPSVIHKIIPAEGPKSGGIEVTVLGSNFYQGLEVMFGDVKATTTTYWGETSLVCLLPPAAVAGLVPVTFKHHLAQSPPQITRQHPTFKYVGDDENQLLRTALTYLNAKINGSIEDTGGFVRRVLEQSGMNWGASSSSGSAGGASGPFPGFALDMDFETQLMKILELVDLDDSIHKPRLNLRRSTGQTMLHLACSLGFHRFAAGLLARGANPEPRDKGGYTPLHMAALNNHPELARRLISYGADPTLRTLSGLTAADMATSKSVLRALKRAERHFRSRSGSLHSRASSATSLKSLWEEPQAHQDSDQPSSEETSSGEESPEYTSGDLESELDDPDADDEAWLDMRRGSVHESRDAPVVDEPLGGLGSPSAAVAAFKEQLTTHVQQIQQTMALHFQNLPPFPTLPQMPNMPPFPEYQAAMQRLAAMMPNLSGLRPLSAGDSADGPSARELDGRWWDLSSLMPSAAPPPAYEEIFPPDQLDQKTASAAEAALDAEADSKCAILFDQPTVTTEAPSSAVSMSTPATASAVKTGQKLPALLQIGRKNAITREQQENLRRAHAERLKRLSRDRNLFFIWIPLLVVVLGAMIYNRWPGPFLAVVSFIASPFSTDQAGPAPAVAAGEGVFVTAPQRVPGLVV